MFSMAIISVGHGEYIGEIATVKSNSKEKDDITSMIENFLANQKVGNDEL